MPLRCSRARWVPALAMLVVQLSCGGGGGDKCPVSAPNCNGGTTGNTPTVNSVSISGAPSSIAVNGSATLTATVSVSNGASQAVTWSSSNTAIVTVTANGSSASLT